MKNLKIINKFKEEYFIKFNKCFEYEIVNIEASKKYIHFIIKNEFGLNKVNKSDLLKNVKPSIQSSLNKEEYFTKQLIKKLSNINYKVIKYTNQKNVIIKDKYGYCKTHANALLEGHNPSIKTAINKKSYFINKFNEKYNKKYVLDNIIISKFNQKINVYCKIHGEFLILPDNLMRGQGCKKCGNINTSNALKENPTGWKLSSWVNSGMKSKNFDSFKVYIIKCWNEDEEFYKIGRTFLKTLERFSYKKRMPYNYKIVKEIVGDAKEMYNLENQLKKENKMHKYKPKINFDGEYECFKLIK